MAMSEQPCEPNEQDCEQADQPGEINALKSTAVYMRRHAAALQQPQKMYLSQPNHEAEAVQQLSDMPSEMPDEPAEQTSKSDEQPCVPAEQTGEPDQHSLGVHTRRQVAAERDVQTNLSQPDHEAEAFQQLPDMPLEMLDEPAEQTGESDEQLCVPVEKTGEPDHHSLGVCRRRQAEAEREVQHTNQLEPEQLGEDLMQQSNLLVEEHVTGGSLLRHRLIDDGCRRVFNNKRLSVEICSCFKGLLVNRY